METAQPPVSETYREGVPKWAWVAIVVSIILAALAFYIGTCITKRKRTRTPNSENGKGPSNRRSWGAGFSGGLWAAA
uniref:Transmembrane protein n=1 Tax=Syphacia muris TaxID=451379 RepID=A0A0N5ANI3_9BILA